MADRTLKLSVVTPEKSLFDEEAEAVTVPAWDGEIGILPGHARLLAKLGLGELRMTLVGGRAEALFIEGGFVQVADDRVTVLTDSACHLQDIDVNEAEQRVAGLRAGMHGPEFAAAQNRLLTMKRVKDRFNRS
jgi:F-type H+-transporting ATPase subunit epsilon